MAGFEPRRNNRGNYACPYCSHKAWKSKQAAINHIKREHEKEATIDEQRLKAEADARKANAERWQAETKASRLQRELDQAKKQTERKWWASGNTNVYCSVEQIVFTNVQMPYGVTPEDTTCHSCGNKSLHIAKEIR